MPNARGEIQANSNETVEIAIEVDDDLGHGDLESQKADPEPKDRGAPLDLVEEMRTGFPSLRLH